MKTLARILAAVLAVLALGGCGKKETVDIALILSEPGGFEGNYFNRGAWDGMERYAVENGLTCAYYEPEARNADEYARMVGEAVDSGAKILVFPGYLLEPTVFAAQNQYPDVGFVLLDGVPNNGLDGDQAEEEIAANTYAVLYAEEQAGFLAGYAAVMDGNRKLGFFGGMSVPAVSRFGHGFVQGAEQAAGELGLESGAVEMRYIYTGSFSPAPEFQARASQWYHQGTQVIFACGGAMGSSVIQAADAAGSWVIGVDTDQSGESDQVLTSALKMVANSVYDGVKAYFEERFPGGQCLTLGADVDGVGLAVETARFTAFGNGEYEEILGRLASGEIAVINNAGDVEELPLTCVEVIQESMR